MIRKPLGFAMLMLLLAGHAGSALAEEPAAVGTTATAANAPASQTVGIAGQIRDALTGELAGVRRVILVANGGPGLRPSKAAQALVADVVAALGSGLEVDTHFVREKTGPDRLFASMNLSNGATATDARALMKKSGESPTAIIALDDPAFIQSVEAMALIKTNNYRCSIDIILAAAVSEKAFQRGSGASVPTLMLPRTTPADTAAQ